MRPTTSKPSPAPPSADEVAGTRDLAEAAVDKANYALEVARDMSLPTKMLALMSWLELRQPPPALGVGDPGDAGSAELLGGAVASVLAQRFGEWELVVVDDGDTDAVEAALSDFDDERIVVVEGRARASGPPATPG